MRCWQCSISSHEEDGHTGAFLLLCMYALRIFLWIGYTSYTHTKENVTRKKKVSLRPDDRCALLESMGSAGSDGVSSLRGRRAEK